MKTGDKVRVVGSPAELPENNELKTRTLFEKCVEKIFDVTEFENIEGLDVLLLRLDVGQILDAEPWEHTIWIEPEYVELLDSKP
jgi:hypothetical protein